MEDVSVLLDVDEDEDELVVDVVSELAFGAGELAFNAFSLLSDQVRWPILEPFKLFMSR